MKRGFTLLELIVVIIILGILASFAIPQLFRTIERARVGEALSIIPTLVQSEVRYGQQYGAYTNSATNLDVELPAMRYFAATFNSTAVANPTVSTRVVTLTRNATARPGDIGAYIITGCSGGLVGCTDGSAGDCLKLGQPASGTVCP